MKSKYTIMYNNININKEPHFSLPKATLWFSLGHLSRSIHPWHSAWCHMVNDHLYSLVNGALRGHEWKVTGCKFWPADPPGIKLSNLWAIGHLSIFYIYFYSVHVFILQIQCYGKGDTSCSLSHSKEGTDAGLWLGAPVPSKEHHLVPFALGICDQILALCVLLGNHS